MRLLLLAFIAVTALSSRAEAGLFCESREDLLPPLRDLEDFAKDAKNPVDYTSVFCLNAVGSKHGAWMRPRVEKACDRILRRDGAKDYMCLQYAVRMNKTELGGLVIHDAVLAFPLEVWGYDGFGMDLWVLTQIGDDAIAAQKIVDAWNGALELAKKREKHSAYMMIWAGWRRAAADTLAKIGTRDHILFLTEQASATKDKYVKAACTKAIKAIEKRLPTP